MSIFSVSDLTRYLKRVFEQDAKLASIYVRGEISNFKQHYSGHCYFTLKDNEAVIKAVMFKSRAQFLKFIPNNGLQVVAIGRVSIYERDGQYQLYIDQLLPQGVGELSLAYTQLKEKLEQEGLFDKERKRPLPIFPKAVGVITSPTGAAVQDIISVARRRHSGIPLFLYPVQVQGEEAPSQIIRALMTLNRLENIDVIVLGRGGGSIEELWAFNDENVVRTIANSNVPIVSAVGHETDFTLADFAADVRAATPSQAAEIVIPDAKELSRYILSLRNAIEVSILNILKKNYTSLERYLNNRVLTTPENLITERQLALDSQIQRAMAAMKNIVANKQQRFTAAAGQLSALNPLAVLARGYSIVHTKDEKIIRSAGNVKVGQELDVILMQGQINVKVINLEESNSYGKK